MRICLVAPGEAGPPEAARAVADLVALLAAEHEVEVVEPVALDSPRVEAMAWSCPEHRLSAGVWEGVRARYPERGPDYLELLDFAPLGFVPLQARYAGDPLMARTLVGVRVWPAAELRDVGDGTRARPQRMLAAELERWVLRQADRLIWPGGDTLDLYRRFYAELELPPALRIPPAVRVSAPAPAPSSPRRGDEPLRILYAGELRRSAGVLDLLEACLGLPGDGWELTLRGADTQTATMGQSVCHTLEAMADGDPRVEVGSALEPEERARLLPGFDLVALPWLLGAWSEVAVAALTAGVPVLATPVGALPELIGDGRAGWLTEGTGKGPLSRALARLQADRGELERVRAAGAGRARVERLADPAPVLAGYAQLAGELVVAEPPVAEPPRVSGVVPYFRASAHVEEAVASLLAQTHPLEEVLIVNDGSFEPADEVLARLAEDPRVTVVTQLNEGESKARNAGALLARGEYLVMLDADNTFEPEFVERALAAYRANPELGYVSCWLRMVDEEGEDMPPAHSYAPLGNGVVESDAENWDGDTLAMLPRRLFTELGFQYGPEGSMHSDWELYRWLRAEGRYGAIIPERLARYRVRPDSLLHRHSAELLDRGWDESRTRNAHRRMRWIANA